MTTLHGIHDPWLVALSVAVAVLASYVALDLSSRIAASTGRVAARLWLVVGALSMGSGIWSVHFIGMLAFRLPIPMAYDVAVALAALLIAIVVSGFALNLVSDGTPGKHRLLIAGVLMGTGIAAMNYTGMASMQITPPVRYDAPLLALSVGIAIAASVLALRIAFRPRPEPIRSAFWNNAASALVMGAAIGGMHYTGMAAAIFDPASSSTGGPQGVSPLWLAGCVGLVAILLLATTLLISAFDARLMLGSVRQAEALRQTNLALEARGIELGLANERLQQQVEERRHAAALSLGQKRVLQMIAEAAPLKGVLEALMHLIESQSPGLLGSVLLLDPDGVHLRHGAAPSLPPAYCQAIDGVAIGARVGSCGTAAFRGEPVVVEDIATDPLWADFRALAMHHGLRACWSTPIRDAQGRVLGTFAIYCAEPCRPSPHHLALIDAATQTAAIAIGHHAAELALRSNMMVLESTFEHIDQGISIVDAELRLVGANRRARELLDFPESLRQVGTPLADFIRHNAQRGDYGAGDVEEQVSTRLALAARCEPHRFERERPNGTILEIRGTPLPGGGFVTVYTDITERARAERELLRFRAALNLTADSIYLVDCKTLAIVDCNDGACRALAYSREELIGLSVEHIFADRTPEQIRVTYARLVAGDNSEANFEALHLRKDGTVFPVEINRRVHRTANGPIVVGVARDITERRLAEAAVKASEAKLRSIVDNALEAVVRINAAGLVLEWNAQAEKTFGWSAAEAVGQLLSGLIVPVQYRQAHERGMRHFLATGEGPVLNRRVELSALRRDGSEFPVDLTITPIRTAEGHEFSAFIRDLSAAAAAEQARCSLEAQLRESQKMEAIGTLAGGIAHDFNNILAAILGHVALARESVGAGSAALASLEQIRRAGQRARSLVEQILAFSRRQEQQLVALPLLPLVDEGRTLLRAALPAGVTIDATLASEPLWVMADATQMQQVLMNLCTNAWHALEGSRGRIEVGLEAVEFIDAGAARPAGLRAGRHAHLWVRDTGRGMSAATCARVFEPFFTTKPVGQGTGLGLSVVHGIVSSHHGAITVDSALGQGSSFHVYLPLCDPGEHVVPVEALAAIRGQGEHVLYIDDDEVMGQLVEGLLQRSGYRVTVCQDPRQALAQVHEQPSAFDLVVCDYNMPDLSGGDVARALAGIRPCLPVVISSGHITESMRTEAKRCRVRELMRKENTFEDLVPVVRRVLAQARIDAGATRY